MKCGGTYHRNQKRHLTVVLTVLADSVVLPASGILKGKMMSQLS